MKTKNLFFFLLAIILIAIIWGIIKNRNEKLAEQGMLDWFNGWTSDLVKIRTEYHERLTKISMPDSTTEDLINKEKLQELKNSLEQTKDLEIWKIDTGLVVSDIWYKKIDQMLIGKINQEQIAFLKSYILDGEKIAIDFRQLSMTYFNDYITVISFMYAAISSGIKLDNNEITKYNDLQSRYIQSQEKYTKKVNEIYAYNVKRVEEFNLQFKNSNVTKLLSLIKNN